MYNNSLHHRIESNLTEILQILTYEWDPLQVKDNPEAEKCYKGYAMALCSLLDLRKPLSAITDYLWMVETQIMEQKGDFARTEKIAQKLFTFTKKGA